MLEISSIINDVENIGIYTEEKTNLDKLPL